jgi:hypothetical protein
MSDIEFEQRVATMLHADVPMDAYAKARIMERVRAVAGEATRTRGLFRRRGARYSTIGLALAAGIGSITTLSALLPPSGVRTGATTLVIGDTVVSTLRDTLRLVRLMFDAPDARQVAVVGEFNGWRASETPLARDGATRRWSATLALRDGVHRYAFVVDGTRWVPDPSAEHVRADDGRLYSILHVARAAN